MANKEAAPFHELLTQYKRLDHELDQLESAIKHFLSGPDTGEIWIDKAQKSKSRVVQILFKEYRSTYDTLMDFINIQYIPIKEGDSNEKD